MVECPYCGCGWRPVAPSRRAASARLAEHMVEVHAREVDADIPDGMVQVRREADGEWVTVTPEAALAIGRGDDLDEPDVE